MMILAVVGGVEILGNWEGRYDLAPQNCSITTT